MSGEAVVLKRNVVYKTNNKLKVIYHKHDFLTHAMKRILSNALNQSHFDYVCPV